MKNFLLLLLLASLFTSCGDDNDACLNDPDCEYFRCKVNGMKAVKNSLRTNLGLNCELISQQ